MSYENGQLSGQGYAAAGLILTAPQKRLSAGLLPYWASGA
jgi:hypothetical protein